MNLLKQKNIDLFTAKTQDNKREQCQICLKLVPRKELVQMDGHDYQCHSASLVCKECLNSYQQEKKDENQYKATFLTLQQKSQLNLSVGSGKTLVAFDSSGSSCIWEDKLREEINQSIVNPLKKIDVHDFCFFSTEVFGELGQPDEFSISSKLSENMLGGTDIDQLFDYVIENNYEQVVIFTDGNFNLTRQYDFKVHWIIDVSLYSKEELLNHEKYLNLKDGDTLQMVSFDKTKK